MIFKTPIRLLATCTLVRSCLLASTLAADVYTEHVQPFTQKYCVRCHSNKQARGELNLAGYSGPKDVTADFRRWNNVIEFVRNGEMPPEEAPQPSLEERGAVTDAIESVLLAEAKKHAGDPGVVLPRRLSNTEYDLSIRDLTGADIRPTADFPADPAAGEGFDNTGEALGMSPSLLKKYLNAATHVSEHLVLKPHGITFAPFRVSSYNERKKLTEQAIIDFYQRHDVRISDYLEAAWRYRHRSQADRDLSVGAWAARHGLSQKYLALVWETLNEASSSSGYLKKLSDLWEAIPAPTSQGGTPSELVTLNKCVEFGRRKLGHREEQLIRSSAANWPIGHLDFRAKTAALRDQFDPENFESEHFLRFDRIRAPNANDKSPQGQTLFLRIDSAFEKGSGDYVLLDRPVFSKSGNPARNVDEEKKHEVVTLRSLLERYATAVAKHLSFGRHPKGHKIDGDSIAVEAPGLIEIPLSPELLREVDGKHLLMRCELDPEHSSQGSVYLQPSAGNPPEDPYAENVELLMRANNRRSKEFSASSQRFCNTFPNRFFYVDSQRGLAAGFHLVDGFFRDDQPLAQKVLNAKQQQELDQLWEELDFVTQSAETLIRGFVWFERSERHVLHDKRFDFLRPEDPLLVEEPLLNRFEREYLDKMGVKLLEDSLKPEKPSDKYDMIHGFFEQIRAGLARQSQLTRAAEQRALSDLEGLARRAYRRPLRPEEVESLRSFYGTLRERGQGVEAALRGVFTAVLMSPDFCFRVTEAPPGSGVHPLSDDALASRLSYFLWSSLPDDELLDIARQGKLQEESVLVTQTRRMLRDPKISAFAREFFGQWLRYRDYLANDPIHASAFPGYDDRLRQAMFEEPTRLATYLIQEDQPITNLLATNETFVNNALATYYGGDIANQYHRQLANWTADFKQRGIPLPSKPEDVWFRVEGLRQLGRGGLFGMGVILAKNSAGERTSPVKRGFWTVHHLLGKHFPPPPADVPALPPNEKQATKTIRQLLSEHVSHRQCAMCHTHFDGLGLAMEGFDPIGRARTKDLAGRAIDNAARLPNGETAKGIPELVDYIEQHRRQDYVRTFCRKFLGYALGRSVVLSDQPLIEKMETALEEHDYRFSVLFETVVASPQFRKQRGRDFVANRP